ncbi:hypothetical protein PAPPERLAPAPP_03200 [Brevundimonas phage vB_BpoS-Papperlapapp]|uniref:Uncharacterized protein n=1 Tax=Brevundimonas phage vB_BpoS-Domovoi TaxID=2948598 RepID=A0A9E7MRC8_9CAUD|nr:hypothetical protein DOMOVOI_02150 [Brevundimonas phage vB_BpoS-Domovoi]USN16061.1 hypothetical protein PAPPERLAPAPP_03200 [Brevundimonas phage vB_BpoS-Papperlapapp]
MSDEFRNYSVLVTQTNRIQIHVMARDEASALKSAQDMALQSHFASSELSAEVHAAWPQFEPEEGPIESDEPGYAWRRGWFWVASLDDSIVALTSAELFARAPKAHAADAQSLRKVFTPLIGGNQSVFNVTRRYGFAARLDGDILWSSLQPNEREMRREARRAVQARIKAEKDKAAEDALAEAKRRMLEPGEAYSLFKTHGGRWSVKSVIGDVSNPGAVTLAEDAWSVDIKTVRKLIAAQTAEVFLRYSTSGDPLAIRLTDAVIRPF